MIFETERLYLRELTQSDYRDLCEILQDEITMAAYAHAFSGAEVQEWLDRQLARYRSDGFGLWAIILKVTNELVGQAGITMQDCVGDLVPEIGYLLKRAHWHNGYAAEAAVGCKRYAFEVLGMNKIYSIIREGNTASQKVAGRNGMEHVGNLVKHYYGLDMPHGIYCVRRGKTGSV